MDFKNIPAFNEQNVYVIIETPKGSRNKYRYDPDLNIIAFKDALPEGHSFPFDFGFIPNTKGEDGDAIDALVLMDAPSFTGCLIKCRVIGAITAFQTEKGKKRRNDRILVVPAASSETQYNLVSMKNVNKIMLEQIEHFFISYNSEQGKKFSPLKKVGHKEAIRLIKKAMVN